MNVMPPPGQTNTGAPPAVTVVKAWRTDRVSRTGVFGPPRAHRAAGARHEQHGRERRLAILADALDGLAQVLGQLGLDGTQRLVEPIERVLLPRCRDHQ